MATKLYVGNLPFNTTENELQELFSKAGAVQEVMLMQDKFTGKSRGFAFVTMGSDADAQKAIAEINGMVKLLVEKMGIEQAAKDMKKAEETTNA